MSEATDAHEALKRLQKSRVWFAPYSDALYPICVAIDAIEVLIRLDSEREARNVGEIKEVAMQNTYSRHSVIQMLAPIVEANDEIQEFVSTRGALLPSDLLKKLSDLDWAIRNAGETREASRA